MTHRATGGSLMTITIPIWGIALIIAVIIVGIFEFVVGRGMGGN